MGIVLYSVVFVGCVEEVELLLVVGVDLDVKDMSGKIVRDFLCIDFGIMNFIVIFFGFEFDEVVLKEGCIEIVY